MKGFKILTPSDFEPPDDRPPQQSGNSFAVLHISPCEHSIHTSIFHTFPLDCHKTSKGQSDPPCTASTNRKASKDRKQKGKRPIGNTTEQENSENPIKIQKTENQKNTQKTEKPKNSVEKGKAVEVPKRRDDVKEGMNKIIY